MKFSSSIILLIFGFFVAQAQQKVTVSASIQKVTVFLQKAQIESAANLRLQKGKSTIIIEDLAGTTDPNSIQLKGKGNFTILGINYQKSASNSRKSLFLDSLNLISYEIENIQMLMDVAEKEKAMIMQNASDIKSNTDGLFTNEFTEMIDFTRKKLTEAGKRKIELSKQLLKLTKKRDEINKKISNLGGVNQQIGELLVTVMADAPTDAALSLTYMASNAGWSPSYDIRSEGTNQPVKLGYRANVYQRTGIDWENVNLTLSTTNPNINNTKPELYPQFLSIYEPIQPVMMRSAKVSAAPMAEGAMMQDEAFSLAEVVNVSETSLSVNFNISIPYSIASTGNPELVDIQSFTVPSQNSYIAVPKYSTSAFLVAKLTDWEKLNLLPGNATVFFEGTYIGTTYIKGSETKDELLISLGVVKKIIIERKELSDFKSIKTIGGNAKESLAFQTTIRNTLNEAITVEVEDQVPVSQDSRIEVSYEPEKGFNYDKTTGKVTYSLSLQPNQTVVKQFNYEVKYPKDLRVSNL